jgi:hypothetical protein
MKTKLLVTGIIGVCLIGGCYFLDPCDNEVSKEIPSPDGSLKAVVFSRNCGATTGFSTQISILRGANATSNDAGNVFVADQTPVDIKWLSNTRLSIAYLTGTETFYQMKQLDGVTVTYRDLY